MPARFLDMASRAVIEYLDDGLSSASSKLCKKVQPRQVLRAAGVAADKSRTCLHSTQPSQSHSPLRNPLRVVCITFLNTFVNALSES